MNLGVMHGHRQFVLALLGLATIGLLPLAASLWLYPEVQALEEQSRFEELEAARQRVKEALASRLAALSRTCEDWAAWDSMHRYAQTGEPREFASENFSPSALNTLALSRIVLFDPAGAERIRQDFDIAEGSATEFPVAPLDGLPPGVLSPERHLETYCIGPDGRLSGLALRPVRRNDGSGPVAGYILMIRPLTAVDIEQISATVGCQLEPYLIDPTGVESRPDPNRPNLIVLYDAGERPVAALDVIPKGAGMQRYFTRMREMISLAGVAVLFVSLGLLALALAASIGGRGRPAGPAVRLSRLLRGGRPLAVGLSLLAGVSLSLMGYHVVQSWARQQLNTEFDRRAERIVAIAESALRMRIEVLRYLEAFLENSQDVTAEQFASFSDVIRAQAQGVDRVAWIRPVGAPVASGPHGLSDQEAEAVIGLPDDAQVLSEDEARALGLLSDFAWELFAPSEQAPGPLPEPVLGMDWSRALRAAGDQGAMQVVQLDWPRDQREPQAHSPPQTLTVIRPVFLREGLMSVAERRASLRGFVVLRLDTAAILSSAQYLFKHAEVSTVLRIDPENVDAENTPIAAANGRPFVSRPILLAGLPCVLEISGGEAARSEILRWLPLAMLFGGLLASFAASSYYATLLQRKDYAEDQVELRTRELAAALLAQTKLSQELIVANERAEAANQAKSRFLAHMSHELRTPMNAILGYSEQLQERLLGPAEQDEALAIIRRNGLHLLELINDVLDYTKIEAEHMTVECLPCDPVELVREVALTLLERAARKGLELKLSIGTKVPREIRTDPTRLRQILINLVGNAVKFTEQGNVHVALRWRLNGPAARPLLAFVVADSGIGLTTAQVSHLFSPFSQGDISMSRRFGGTGLGLAISRRLARLLGGDVTVSSAPGRGSVFTLSIDPGEVAIADVDESADTEREIPLTAAAESKAEQDAAEQSPSAAPEPRGAAPVGGAAPQPDASAPPTAAAAGLAEAQPLAGWRILLVEDGPDNQRLIAAILTRSGARVEVAEDGEQAVQQGLAALRQGAPFDLILMDMQMPQMDGYTATRLLRSKGYLAPIVALTAHAMSGERERCLASGCDEYATKPIDRRGLLAVVQRVGRGRGSAAHATDA